MRVPQPLLRRRLPSGRGATEQPNVTSDTDARLSPRFWVAVVATGVATGLAGIAMMVVLSVAEHLAFGVSRRRHRRDADAGGRQP